MCNKSQWTSSAKKRVLIIIILVIICGVLLFLNVIQNGEIYCKNSNCIRASADILELIDNKTEPCNNFYNFICGQFSKKAEIFKVDTMLEFYLKRVRQQFDNIILESVHGTDSKALRLQKEYYQSCTNLDAIDNDDDKTFWQLITELGGWPVTLGNNWDENSFDFIELIVQLRKLGLQCGWFLNVSVHSSNNLEINIPDDVERIDGKSSQNYVDLMTNIAVDFGAYNQLARKEMREVMHFQNRLANLIEETRNQSSLVHPSLLTISEIQIIWQKINWLEFLKEITNDKLSEDDKIIFHVKNYLPKLDTILRQTRKRTQVNYVIWKLIESYTPILSSKIRNKIAHYRKNADIPEDLWQTDRSTYCYDRAKSFFPHILEATYLRREINANKYKKIEEMIKRIGKQIEKKLIKSWWIDNITKKIALEKLRRIVYIIGGPEEMYNETQFDRIVGVEKMEFQSKNLFTISTEILSKGLDFYYDSRKIADDFKWRFYDTTISTEIRFLRDDNILYVPAGILSFYDPNQPNFINYGKLGTIIGHELTHAFDIATTYNHQIWWSNETTKNFLKAIHCLENCNDGIPEDEVSCNHTLLENLADYTGINLSYEAYQQWIAENGKELLLPSLKYTPEQLFWISYGTIMCHINTYKMRPQYLSPAGRIIASYRNSRYFGTVYNCPLNSNMNPSEKCELF